MKKLMIAAAVMAAGVAMADGIVSSEVVGYQTQTLGSGKLTMFAVPFQHVNNDGKGLMLNSDLTIANATKADYYVNADQIWVWNPNTESFKKFYFYTGEYGTGWSETTGNEEFFEDCEGFENGLPEGSAVYYNAKSAAGKAATGSGAVESLPEYEIPLYGGCLTMVANPYPVATQLNSTSSVTFTNPTKADYYVNADQIWVWNPDTESYKKFYYYTGEYGTGWSETTGDEDFIEDCGGFENGLPAGSAFFFNAKPGTGKSIVFKRGF